MGDSNQTITGKRLITAETRKEMKKVLTEIQDGTFASEFMTEKMCIRDRYRPQ